MFAFLSNVFKSLAGWEKPVIGLSHIKDMSNDDILQDLTHPASFGKLANNFKSIEGNVTFGNIQVNAAVKPNPANSQLQPFRQQTSGQLSSPFFNTLRKPGS